MCVSEGTAFVIRCRFGMSERAYEAWFLALQIALATVVCSLCTVLVAPLVNEKFYPKFREFTVANQVGCNARVTTFLYSVFACAASLFALASGITTVEDFVSASPTTVVVLCACSVCGYCVSDTYFFIRHWENHSDGMLIHHVTVVLAVGFANFYYNSWFFTPFRLLTELSSPFLMVQISMKAFNMSKTRMYQVNGAVTTICYFIVRILIIPIGYWILYSTSKTPSYTSLSLGAKMSLIIPLLVTDFLNLWWFSKIMTIIRKMFSRATESKGGEYGTVCNGSERIMLVESKGACV